MLKTTHWSDWCVGFSAGALLTAMLKCNSLLGENTTPIFASWAAHGIGALVTGLIVAGVRFRTASTTDASGIQMSVWWSHLGGIPGAIAVILAVIAVNSWLGLVGAISLMLTGQILFGIVIDHLGLFGATRRPIAPIQFLVASCVIAGSTLIIAY